ncbi:MAG: uracil-DNA glycosylase [Candidatus Nomurabacteria bacterium]|nr:MAG: uracil-DNA glycosylase [Candidatus Nomurabacteria bacterium]HRV75900.1 uracil-DNA glycosylase [Candidatus Saccharimonadales bacterium]
MEAPIDKTWKLALGAVFKSKEFKSLACFIKKEYSSKKIYPESKNIFRALNLTPLDEVKVVIIGQDPYHGSEGGLPQAQGLSFSVTEYIKNPPSLQNIFKELEAEFNKKPEAEIKFNGDLTSWAKQGVLLLNSTLTVEAGKANSHADLGWESLTNEIIKLISNKCDGVVFLLWGAYARKKKKLIDANRHLVLESAHPSPFSAYSGFFGNNHFRRVNEWLKYHGKDEIVW